MEPLKCPRCSQLLEAVVRVKKARKGKPVIEVPSWAKTQPCPEDCEHRGKSVLHIHVGDTVVFGRPRGQTLLAANEARK